MTIVCSLVYSGQILTGEVSHLFLRRSFFKLDEFCGGFLNGASQGIATMSPA
jgi:hypothetical protein